MLSNPLNRYHKLCFPVKAASLVKDFNVTIVSSIISQHHRGLAVLTARRDGVVLSLSRLSVTFPKYSVLILKTSPQRSKHFPEFRPVSSSPTRWWNYRNLSRFLSWLPALLSATCLRAGQVSQPAGPDSTSLPASLTLFNGKHTFPSGLRPFSFSKPPQSLGFLCPQ